MIMYTDILDDTKTLAKRPKQPRRKTCDKTHRNGDNLSDKLRSEKSKIKNIPLLITSYNQKNHSSDTLHDDKENATGIII